MMVSLLEQQLIMPVLMTLPPIDPDRYVEHLCRSGFDRFTIMYWLEDTERMYHVQQAYSDRIREIASDTGARLLDIRTGFLKAQDYGTLLCKDGIHPNEEGHLLIWNTLHDYLKCCRPGAAGGADHLPAGGPGAHALFGHAGRFLGVQPNILFVRFIAFLLDRRQDMP